MFPNYDPDEVKIILSQDDIAAIQELYGSRDGRIPPVTPPTEKPPIPPATPTPPVAAPTTDTDGDGLDDQTEIFVVGTSPYNPDTDGDGLIDYEVVYGLNPLNPDTDGDGVWDGQELADGTDPLVPDQTTGGAEAYAGYYFGYDDIGSALVIEVSTDGLALGTFRVFEFGNYVDYSLGGVVLDTGDIILVSYDYFFSFIGQIVGGVASGTLETAGGYVGGWGVTLQVGPTVTSDDDDGGGGLSNNGAAQVHLANMEQPDSSVYQPVPSQQQPLTHKVHDSVQ